MERSFVLVIIAATVLNLGSGDTSVSDYIYWKKADISAWHQFFPSRVLEEERVTLEEALTAVQSLALGLNDSLSSVVAFQAQELQTAELLMQGTDAQGCVQGIANYMQNAIDDEMTSYLNCAADAESKLLRLNETWGKIKTNYQAAYQRALKGIDACAKNYPNKDSITRLKSCVESMNKNYFASVGNTQIAVIPSPSMSYFQQKVVGCASTAAENVASKGWKFLGMLVECSKLSGTIDPEAYAEELSKWKGYNDTLNRQIIYSQLKNYNPARSVEVKMLEYYNLQKKALEQFVIESRGLNFYLNKTYLLLSDYYNTVTATSLDNPGDAACTDVARSALDAAANDGHNNQRIQMPGGNHGGSGVDASPPVPGLVSLVPAIAASTSGSSSATKSLSCDVKIVNNTKTLISEVTDDFLVLITLMPSIGNAALLKCFSQGYVFAPNTIADCYDLVYPQFDVDHSDRRAAIEADVTILEEYAATFFSGTDLPCGGSSLRRLLLGGDLALYNLQRCIYIGSGTTYSVSTPNPSYPYSTTTPSWSTYMPTTTHL